MESSANSTKERMRVLPIISGVILSVVASMVLILIFAFLIKWFDWPEGVITPINIAIKLLSIAVGVLIATKEEGVALAGVMGGENSEIDDNTVNIALEAAFFPPVTTRRSAKSVGLRTEANARFERGVDIETVKPALLRAIQLLIELHIKLKLNYI